MQLCYGDQMDTALDFNDAVAAELRRQRTAQGLTIDEVARRAEMVRTTVLRYLNGKRAIPIGALYGLSAALCVEAHRVVAAAEASCAVVSPADAHSAEDTPDSAGAEVWLGRLNPVRSQGKTSTRDHGQNAPPMTVLSAANIGSAVGEDLAEHHGTKATRACMETSDDTSRRVEAHRGVSISV